MQELDHTSAKILLAEDSPADVLLMRMALEDAGVRCELRVVDDGVKAIAEIQAREGDSAAAPIDLFLIDVNLPKLDGIAVVARLRETTRYAQTPVLVMTSYSAPQDAARLKEFAGVRLWTKPSDLDEYLKVGSLVGSLLAGRKPAGSERSPRARARGAAQ